MDPNCTNDESYDKRIYVGNIDHKISEANLIKMFSPFGKIISEEFVLHTRGPKRGEPRGFAFVQYNTNEEARLAKEKMHGRLACGRPLIVRLACEKAVAETSGNSSKGSTVAIKSTRSAAGNTPGQMSRSAKIAAIKNKLQSLEEDGSSSAKKQKQFEGTSS